MRPYVLRALLRKEVDRHVANRGGIALAALLVVAALLLAVFNPGATGAAGPNGDAAAGPAGALVGGVHHCYVEYMIETPLVTHLKANVPPELATRVVFRKRTPGGGLASYPTGIGAIQIRSGTDAATGRPVAQFFVWHPPGDPGAMAPYELWFWTESLRGLAAWAAAEGAAPTGFAPPDFADGLAVVRDAYKRLDAAVTAAATGAGAGAPANPLPVIDVKRTGLGGKPLDVRDAVATAMVVFALYFTCVYLLPTLTCEERERGVLLAQALSPASPAEILAAKFLFYPAMGIGLAAAIAGIYRPGVLATPFFWLGLLAVGGAFLGIGMTVASLATTQRAAFVGSMCYLFAVALLLMICQQNNIPGLPLLAIEYHGPRVIHAAMTANVQMGDWGHLLAAAGLAGVWVFAAGRLFRKRGWQ